jgi:hypothetical protein
MTLVQETGGGITVISRQTGFDGYFSTQRSTDGGATWNAAHAMMTRDISHGGIGGGAGLGEVAPMAFRLDNGYLVNLGGRVSGGYLNVGVCTDGGAGGLGVLGHSVWERWDLVAHHNLYDEGAAASVPMKIRSILASDETDAYMVGWQTGANRITVAYMRTPNLRNEIGSVFAQANQVYFMDLDFS